MLLWPLIGLYAAGVAYVGAYLIYLPLVLMLVKPLCALKFDLRNILLTVIFLLFVVSAFFLVHCLTGWTLLITGIVLFTCCLVLSGFEFNQFLPSKEWIPKFKKLFRG